MSHTFLMESGRWTLDGFWLERNVMPIPVKGRTLVGWTKDDWFTMVTKLVFPDSNLPETTQAYKGRLDADERRFTFVLTHSGLGKVEGEGWVAPESIVQRYWVMDDKLMRTGFQTFYKKDADHYFMTSGIIAGANLISSMEGILTRHPDPE